MQYKDFPRNLKEHMTYLNIQHDLVLTAFTVARELDLYIEQHFQSTYPLANVEASAATLTVSIGDVCVWCSEIDGAEDLTFPKCLDAYREYIDGLNEIFQSPATNE